MPMQPVNVREMLRRECVTPNNVALLEHMFRANRAAIAAGLRGPSAAPAARAASPI